MALPSSGPISFSDINVDLGNSSTAQLSLRTASAAKGFSSPDSMSEFYTVRYYNLNSCAGGANPTTSIPPVLGTQRYVWPTDPGGISYYTYAGGYSDLNSPPGNYNSNLQIVSGQSGCP